MILVTDLTSPGRSATTLSHRRGFMLDAYSFLSLRPWMLEPFGPNKRDKKIDKKKKCNASGNVNHNDRLIFFRKL